MYVHQPTTDTVFDYLQDERLNTIDGTKFAYLNYNESLWIARIPVNFFFDSFDPVHINKSFGVFTSASLVKTEGEYLS